MKDRRNFKLYLLIGIMVASNLFLIGKTVYMYNVLPSANKDRSDYVHVDDFGANGEDEKDDADAIQKAIDYAAKSGLGKVKITGNTNYIVKSGITIKSEVELELDQNTRVFVHGDFPVFFLEANASLVNGRIEIVDSQFNSEVIHLDGAQRFWSWERTRVFNVSLINSSGNHRGTGIALTANEPDQMISFVNFSNVNIVGFHYGIFLEVEQSGKTAQNSFINGNRFSNITLDSCVRCIDIISSDTIPNEASGNTFTGLQIQPSEVTEIVLSVSGSDNTFEGVIWDAHLQDGRSPLVIFTEKSVRSRLISNLEDIYIRDEGYLNRYFSPEEKLEGN